MSKKRHAESEDVPNSEQAPSRSELNRIGDLEGETLAAVRAACRHCHMPLPTTCLAYSLFKVAKSESKNFNSNNLSGPRKAPSILQDQDSEFMQLEIKSKLGRSGAELGSRRPDGSSRFFELVERHAVQGPTPQHQLRLHLEPILPC